MAQNKSTGSTGRAPGRERKIGDLGGGEGTDKGRVRQDELGRDIGQERTDIDRDLDTEEPEPGARTPRGSGRL